MRVKHTCRCGASVEVEGSSGEVCVSSQISAFLRDHAGCGQSWGGAGLFPYVAPTGTGTGDPTRGYWYCSQRDSDPEGQ